MYLVLLSKENCTSFPDQIILERSSNMSFEWTWYKGSHIRISENKIYMKGLLRSDSRSGALFKIVGKEWGYVYMVKEVSNSIVGNQ